MNNPYEKTNLLDRIREFGTLIIFICFSLIASIIVMNVVIFPIALFSIKHESLFSYLIINLFWILILVSIIYLLIKRILFYKKNDVQNSQIAKILLLKPFLIIFSLFLILIFLIIIISIIYILLKNNYYLLYKIINI